MASKVVFAANYTTNQNLYANELEVMPEAKVTFTENAILTITKQFTVAKTAQLVFEDNAQLFNKGITSPNAVITIKRRTRKIDKFDYTYFCSPVSGQILNQLVDPDSYGFYTNTDKDGNQMIYTGPLADKYQYFDSAATPISYYSPYYDKGAWIIVPDPGAINTMDPVGRGYIVRGPQSFRWVGDGGTKQYWYTAFTGEPHSGDYTLPVSGNVYTPFTGALTPSTEPCNNEKFTPVLIGNPYPSTLDADTFLTNATNRANLSGTIAMWTHNTGPSSSTTGDAIYNYTANDFVLYNLVGGVGTGRTNEPNYSQDNSNRPTGKIATCQGFFTKAIVAGATAAFTESMRVSPGAAMGQSQIDQEQFYRLNGTATITPLVKNRFWLSLQAGSANDFSGKYSETLVGYMPAATTTNGTIAGSVNTYDKMYDSELNTTFYGAPELSSRLEIYTIINPTTTCPRLAIQGRKLDATFNTSEVVSIGFSCPSGTYTIRVEKLDGLFETQQLFWLRQTQGANVTYHDIRNNSLTFTSGGDADNSTRFAIVFKLPLIGIVSVPLTCGTKLQSMSHAIYSQQVSGATSYRFEVRSGAPFGSAGSNFLGEITTTTNQFNLQAFNAIFPITYDEIYYIRVTTLQIDGVWQYGNTCTVTSAAPPTAGISAPTTTQAGCGSILNSYSAQLYCNQPSEVGYTTNGYRFEVSTDPAFAFGTVVGNIERNSNNFSLAMLNTAANSLGLYQPIPNQDYFIRVQIRYSYPTANTWQVNNFGNPIYGAICSVRTGNNPTARATENDFTIFEVKAYPNPFASAFNLEINTSSDEKVTVNTFDMIGRLIDTQEVQATEISIQEIGNQFPAGVYNIVVTQGENVKTLRVIKR